MFDTELVWKKDITEKIKEGKLSKWFEGLEGCLLSVELGANKDIRDSSGNIYRFLKNGRQYSWAKEETFTNLDADRFWNLWKCAAEGKEPEPYDYSVKKVTYVLPVKYDESSEVIKQIFFEMMFTCSQFNRYPKEHFYFVARTLQSTDEIEKHTLMLADLNRVRLSTSPYRGKLRLVFEDRDKKGNRDMPYVMEKIEAALERSKMKYTKKVSLAV